MANEIQELLNRIGDDSLRTRLDAAIRELRNTRTFGLSFEKHIPELLPVYTTKVRRRVRVARKTTALTDTFIVKQVTKGVATVRPEQGDGEDQSIPVADLVVVKRFGEPIFPALRPVESVLRGGDTPHHTLIESDNYHALQLLEWLYSGKVDCIYIDPPYNTGARDWKYNNDYVDDNDDWRHSKWLAFMEKRLKIAHRLLNPDTGVLIVTVDEHEVHHLGMLLEQEFRGVYRQMVTIVITARGVAKQGLARVEEYALYTYLGSSSASTTEDDFLTDDSIQGRKAPWASLLRRGTNAAPKDRAGLVYPLLLDPDTKAITGVGETLADRVMRGELRLSELNTFNPIRTKGEAWPIRSDGALGTWQVKPATLLTLKEKGFVKLGRFDENRTSWSVNYLKRGPLREIERGDLLVKGYQWEGGPAILEYVDDTLNARRAKTVWHRTTHDAGTYGSNLLRSIVGSRAFEFPKSIYAVRDTLSTIVGDKPSAIVLDFFAGSGTTLHALNLLNAADKGNRRCILVTNNELSEAESERLLASGLQPGNDVWESHGICQAVTFPRCKFAINGQRDDGTELPGDYLSGQSDEQEVDRNFRSMDFTCREALWPNAAGKRKKAREALAQAIGFTKSKVTGTEDFLMAEDERVALLLDPAQLAEFIEQGSEWADNIETVYLPFPSGKPFNEARAEVAAVWPPLVKNVEIKWPMKRGFAANLDYFRLEFLDRSQVETGGKLADLLPSLWMMAGCRGSLPTAKGNETMLFFPDCSFAVLVEESAIRPFLAKLKLRPDVTWVFLVTNNQDTFSRLSERLSQAA